MTTTSRALPLAALGAAFAACYALISHAPLRPPTEVAMPEGVSFIPEAAPLYLVMLPAGWFLPLLIRDEARYRACIRATVLAFALTTSLWLLIPTVLLRPPAPDGWLTAPWRLIACYDQPTNVFPCGHILAPTISAWFVGTERTSWRPWLALAWLAGAASIAMTWQHRPIDILAGTLIAGLAIAVCRRMQRS